MLTKEISFCSRGGSASVTRVLRKRRLPQCNAPNITVNPEAGYLSPSRDRRSDPETDDCKQMIKTNHHVFQTQFEPCAGENWAIVRERVAVSHLRHMWETKTTCSEPSPARLKKYWPTMETDSWLRVFEAQQVYHAVRR